MTSSHVTPRLALALLAAGSAAALAAACGGGEDGGRVFQHATMFVVAGSHQGFTCDQCHDPAAPSYGLAGGGVSCVGCHKDADVTPSHAGVTGYTWSDASCIGCHKDGSGGLPANHNTALFPVTGKHAGARCAQCHGPTRRVEDLTCTSCHEHDQATMATAHAAIPGVVEGIVNYQWASTSCVRCHADAKVFRISSHEGGEDGINRRHSPWCINCHFFLRPAGDKPWGADFGRRDRSKCDACHAVRGGG